MKINNTAFGRVQNKALQAGVGGALDAVVAKVDDVDSRMLNYTGDWVSGNEYHENDVVTWATDGHLYEVIKAHTSSATFDPDNPEYYKAMTAAKLASTTITNGIEKRLLALDRNKVVDIAIPVTNFGVCHFQFTNRNLGVYSVVEKITSGNVNGVNIIVGVIDRDTITGRVFTINDDGTISATIATFGSQLTIVEVK